MGRPDMVERVLLVILGGVLTLLCTIIFDAIRRQREDKEVKIALQNELDELQFRLASSVMGIQMHIGEFSRENIEWMLKIARKYNGPYKSEEQVRVYEAMLSRPDEEFAAAARMKKAPLGKGLSLKKYTAPYLESKIGFLSGLTEEQRQKLFTVKARLDMLNEEIDQARFFSSLTFQSGIDDEVLARVYENIDQGYRFHATHGKITVDLINSIEL